MEIETTICRSINVVAVSYVKFKQFHSMPTATTTDRDLIDFDESTLKKDNSSGILDSFSLTNDIAPKSLNNSVDRINANSTKDIVQWITGRAAILKEMRQQLMLTNESKLLVEISRLQEENTKGKQLCQSLMDELAVAYEEISHLKQQLNN